PADSSLIASSRLVGAWYSNLAGNMAPPSLPPFSGLNRPPDPLRAQRHVEMGDAEVGKGVDHRVDHRRRAGDGAGLANTLDPHWIDRAGRHSVLGLEGRQLAGGWDRIVHQRACDELSVLIVGAFLIQRLGHALCHPAV